MLGGGACVAGTECCVDDGGEGGPPAVVDPPLTFEDFTAGFDTLPAERAEGLFPHFNEAANDLVADLEEEEEGDEELVCLRMSAFVAQLGHESNGLVDFDSTESGEKNEGSARLGNTQPGDGIRYKGRGPIRLTGRKNYAAAGRLLNLPLEANPELVSLPSVGFKTSLALWNANNLNVPADKGTLRSFYYITRRISGGYDGILDRLYRWLDARKRMGCL